MTDLDHRVGVRENNLVVRNLKLSNVTSENIDAPINIIKTILEVLVVERTTSFNLCHNLSSKTFKWVQNLKLSTF